MAIPLYHRIATKGDVETIREIMRASIAENMKSDLSPEEIVAAQETMGLDMSLIEDGTYFIIESDHDNERVAVGCGGWGKRRTLFGGDHTVGRDDSFSDPAHEPARIRAMYTHPNWIRRGVGRYLVEISEAAAREAGFKTIELGATISGYPLYCAVGYEALERETRIAENGAENVIIKMTKLL